MTGLPNDVSRLVSYTGQPLETISVTSYQWIAFRKWNKFSFVAHIVTSSVTILQIHDSIWLSILKRSQFDSIFDLNKLF